MRKSVHYFGAVIVGLGLMAGSAMATVKIAKETSAKCVSCHAAAGKKELSKAGECYKEKKDLKACNIAPAK